jgi:hypothetical protein
MESGFEQLDFKDNIFNINNIVLFKKTDSVNCMHDKTFS